MNYLLWQLADSGFPAGGFAHSGGLEAGMQHGHVTDGDSLWAFARQAVIQAGRSALPLVTAVHRNLDDLAQIDRLSDVFLSNPAGNRASAAQGRAFLTSASRSFPHAPIAVLEAGCATTRWPAITRRFSAPFCSSFISTSRTRSAFFSIWLDGVSDRRRFASG